LARVEYLDIGHVGSWDVIPGCVYLGEPLLGVKEGLARA
jgi:hypothetical protein